MSTSQTTIKPLFARVSETLARRALEMKPTARFTFERTSERITNVLSRPWTASTLRAAKPVSETPVVLAV